VIGQHPRWWWALFTVWFGWLCWQVLTGQWSDVLLAVVCFVAARLGVHAMARSLKRRQERETS
jgi:hypothetical protein